MMSVITGKVAFANLTEHEVFNGQSTGKYSVVVTLDDEQADKLQAEGVKLKTYKNESQRKFATKFEDFQVIDNDGEPVSRGSVRWGDTVRIKYGLGKPHPVHGTSVYLQAIRVIEKAEFDGDDDSEF
jgi:hypothetical protein